MKRTFKIFKSGGKHFLSLFLCISLVACWVGCATHYERVENGDGQDPASITDNESPALDPDSELETLQADQKEQGQGSLEPLTFVLVGMVRAWSAERNQIVFEHLNWQSMQQFISQYSTSKKGPILCVKTSQGIEVAKGRLLPENSKHFSAIEIESLSLQPEMGQHVFIGY